MKHKPLIFTILSILFMIDPLIKILYFKTMTDFDLSRIMDNLLTRTTVKEIFDFWLVFPLAGLTLIKIRKWSYFVFLGFLCYIVFSFLTYDQYTWPYFSESPLFYHYAVVGLSVMVFSFFLFPQIREPFFNKRIRWWEPKRRYNVSINSKVSGSKMTVDSQIFNISETGAFIKDSPYFNPGDSLQIEFDSEGLTFDLPMKVINRHTVDGIHGVGILFKPKSMAQKFRIYKLIQRLKNNSALPISSREKV